MLSKELIRDILQNKNFVMLLSSVVFMFGILTCFSTSPILGSLVLTVLLLLLLLFNVFSCKRVLLLVLIFYCGFFIAFFRIKNYDSLLLMTPAKGVFTGVISSVPVGDSEKVKFSLDIEDYSGQKVKGKTLVMMPKNKDKQKYLNIGQKVSVSGSLRKPFVSTNPSQFDYSAYLKNFNIFTVLYNNDGDIKCLKSKISFRWKFLQYLNITRNKILNIHSSYLESPNLEILGGIVFGDDAVAPPDYIKNSFINSGLLHILAASGMNVGLIFSFWVVILRFLRIPYRIRILSGMFVIILYTLMTGMGASVVRAALMILLVLIGKLIDRDAHSVSLLSLVAVLMLIYNPAYINNVSFQLSFLVTLGLLTTANIIFTKIKKIPNWLVAPIIIPIVAQIWIIPIQMFYFNTISLYSVFANIATVSIVSVISFAGFISSILALFKPISEFICYTFDFYNNYLLNLLVSISDYFANLPHCALQTIHPHIYQIVFYYVALISLTFLLKCEKYKNALIILVASFVILSVTSIRPVSKNLEIIAFDVGNADSFLIKTPQNKYFFVDTGKNAYKSANSQAKIIMLKYLKDRGIKNIEGVIVTHFDNDHSGGTKDFIENTRVKTLYLNNTDVMTQTSKDIFSAVSRINQKVLITQNNNLIYSEPALLMKTFKAHFDGTDKSNQNSTILLLKYKDFEMLFMADADSDSFEQIKGFLPHNIEVLKVGHHGGPNVVSQNMLDYINNKVSLISTGLNYFNHPNQGTLDLLRNTIILRTDNLNSIKISTDGVQYKIYSYDAHDKKYKFKENFISK